MNSSLYFNILQKKTIMDRMAVKGQNGDSSVGSIGLMFPNIRASLSPRNTLLLLSSPQDPSIPAKAWSPRKSRLIGGHFYSFLNFF